MAKPTTREHLIETGLRQIHALGYNATGVKEILDLAEVPKGSFYHYFPSKESFVEEVLARYTANEAERAQATLGDFKLTPLKRLRKYFESLVEVYGQGGAIPGCLLGNLSLELGGQSTHLQPAFSAAFANWQQPIAATLREAAAQGEIPKSLKPDETAAFLLNSWEGALLRMKADKSDKPLHTFLDFVFNSLLKK